MTFPFKNLKEYQADIKRRHPLGVPWVTPYEAFCQHYYNFDVIAREYGLQREDNNRPLKTKPKVIITKPIVKTNDYF
jgi:hypothetical protein